MMLIRQTKAAAMRTALALTVALTCAVSVHAQTPTLQPLKAGDTIQGKLAKGNSQANSVGRLYDCYTLETKPGSHWEIILSPKSPYPFLGIGRGKDCKSIDERWDLQDTSIGNLFARTARLRFTAGGGVYVVRALLDTRTEASYTLAVKEDPNGSGHATLPPGLRPPPKVIVGSASTVAPSPSAVSFTPGQTFRDCDICPELVVLPAGKFMMGSPDTEEGRNANEGPMHQVTIGRSFAMGKLEVTFDEYEACVADGYCEASRSDGGWGRGRRPAIAIGYQDALHYVAWLSAKTGAQYFVPSEAEWEYAARAGTTTPWNTGSAIITADANFLKTFGKTVPVGSYPPNAFGLHDMHGNAWEWTQDCMDAGYLGVPVDGSAAASGDCLKQRVPRGGGHFDTHNNVRSAKRTRVSEESWSKDLGFRVARAL